MALNTGMILREMLRHEVLAKTLLYSDRFYTFPDHIEKTTFGVSCDAFANFKETLTRHKGMVAEYLEKNYDKVCCCIPLLYLIAISFNINPCNFFSSSTCIKVYFIQKTTLPRGSH